jgi:hypothetical protein
LANFIYPIEGLPEKMCATCQTQIIWTLAFQQQIYENELTLRMQLVMGNDSKFLDTSANDTDCGDEFRTEDLLDTEIAEENKEFNSTPFAAIEDMPVLVNQVEPTASNYVLENENKPTERSAEDDDMESDDVLKTESNKNLLVMDIENDETTETNNDGSQNKFMETFRNPVIEIKNSNRTSSKSAGGDTKFQCHCGKSFSWKKDLVKHKKTHDEKFEALLRCSECGKKFSTKQQLNEHLKTIHQGYFYECPICGRKQSNIANSRTHIKKEHPGSSVRPVEKCNK